MCRYRPDDLSKELPSASRDVYKRQDISLLVEFGLQPRKYYLLVARLEPENNIEMDIHCLLYTSNPFLRKITKHDIMLSTGGDMMCYACLLYTS